MGTSEESTKAPKQIPIEDPAKGSRVSGKWWKKDRKAFRIRSLGVNSSWRLKKEQRLKDQQFKAKLKELQDEKEKERQARVDKIKERRQKKEEKERYELLATKMHKKKLERLKRREKRNKLLKER
ncbi:DEKNAAC104984 [Brettanomyces naardenensis]|uniref:rRNA-processing protein n=1 Tax=Brettanomyces naardenensis TaxID=13370 RepID=A0A448YSD8_BRENA|nr:DEKNAAC104984 [Brettanomyces naardenensis]